MLVEGLNQLTATFERYRYMARNKLSVAFAESSDLTGLASHAATLDHAGANSHETDLRKGLLHVAQVPASESLALLLRLEAKHLAHLPEYATFCTAVMDRINETGLAAEDMTAALQMIQTGIPGEQRALRQVIDEKLTALKPREQTEHLLSRLAAML